MRDLAGDVGVEAASLYNHISSKAELLQEISFRNSKLNQNRICGFFQDSLDGKWGENVQP